MTIYATGVAMSQYDYHDEYYKRRIAKEPWDYDKAIKPSKAPDPPKTELENYRLVLEKIVDALEAATKIINSLENRVKALEQAIAIKCHCGNVALERDYLCSDCREQANV